MLKIDFEGTDGAGKTTALKYFMEQAKNRGLSVIETREVGNPNVPSCVKMREFVLNPDSKLSGEAMELIFCAMRFENEKWLEELKRSGKAPDIVVSDRGWASHLAYTDHNVSEQFTEDLYLNFMKHCTSLPDVVIYFGVNIETALARRVKRGEGMDVIEMKGVEYQEKVRESFNKYLNDSVMRDEFEVYDVDANDSIEGVRKQVDEILDDLEARIKVNQVVS